MHKKTTVWGSVDENFFLGFCVRRKLIYPAVFFMSSPTIILYASFVPSLLNTSGPPLGSIVCDFCTQYTSQYSFPKHVSVFALQQPTLPFTGQQFIAISCLTISANLLCISTVYCSQTTQQCYVQQFQTLCHFYKIHQIRLHLRTLYKPIISYPCSAVKNPVQFPINTILSLTQ